MKPGIRGKNENGGVRFWKECKRNRQLVEHKFSEADRRPNER